MPSAAFLINELVYLSEEETMERRLLCALLTNVRFIYVDYIQNEVHHIYSDCSIQIEDNRHYPAYMYVCVCVYVAVYAQSIY